MSAYYFLVSQLPLLNLAAPPPWTSGRFAATAARLMSPGDAALLGACVLAPSGAAPSGSAVIDGFAVWESALRVHLARARAARLKREAHALPEAPIEPLDAAAAARAAFSVESPLEAELILVKARWDAVEALQGGDYFGREAVYAYYLKLQLLERKALFRVEEGVAAYRVAYAAVLNAAQTSLSPGEPA